MQEIIDKIYSIVWSDALVYLCLLAGVYFSIRFKLPQLIYLKEMVRLLFKGGEFQERDFIISGIFLGDFRPSGYR